MRVPNYFLKTEREKKAVKIAKSEHKQELIRKYGKDHKVAARQDLTIHKLTN